MVQEKRVRLPSNSSGFVGSYGMRSKDEISFIQALVVMDIETALMKAMVLELKEENERLRNVISKQAEEYSES